MIILCVCDDVPTEAWHESGKNCLHKDDSCFWFCIHACVNSFFSPNKNNQRHCDTSVATLLFWSGVAVWIRISTPI